MARYLSQTLIRESLTVTRAPPRSHLFPSSGSLLLRSSSRLVTVRSRSHRPDKPAAGQLIEVDIESEASGVEVEVLGIRRLEDAIHRILVRRSAPDWLPFIPGSSYWVPPRKGGLGIVELVGRVSSPLNEEESLSLTTVRGWPSLAYFVEGTTPQTGKTEEEEEEEEEEATTQSDEED